MSFAAMRCDNCGWNNPDGLTKCQKCNQELTFAKTEAPTSWGGVNPNFNQTILEPGRASHNPAPISESQNCVKCGYPLSPDSAFCPNCGFQVSQPAQQNIPDNKKTVRVLPEEFMAEEKTSAPAPAPAPTPDPAPAPAPEVLKQTVREIPLEMLEETVPPAPEVVPEPQPEETPVPEPVPSFNLTAIDSADLCKSSYEGEEVVVDDVTFKVKDGNWSAEAKENNEIIVIRHASVTELQEGDIIVIGANRYVFSK